MREPLRSKDASGSIPGMDRIISRALLVSSVLTTLLVSLAQARWQPGFVDNSPETQNWFSTQRNEKGQWCYNESDGHRFDGTYEFDKDGNVTVWANGQKYPIEHFKVLRGHNPTGSAVWWYLDTADNGRTTYCFSPGSLS